MADARVIIALAAEADDDFIWNRLDALQTEMFMAGPVAVKFSYFGREGFQARSRPFVATRWARDADDMAALLDHARADCVCGCFVNAGDIFEAALNEKEPVQAIIIIGDRFYGDEDTVMRQAGRLRARGTRLILFQQGQTRGTDNVFRALAERTDGAYFQFNPAVERIAERLPGLFEAVTHFAIGGERALEARAQNNESAAVLLEQMTAPARLK
jgi:hypothetical protein